MNTSTTVLTAPAPLSNRILHLAQVKEYTGLNRSTIYDIQNLKSPRHDPSFPKCIHLTANTAGWLAREIENWIETKIATRP